MMTSNPETTAGAPVPSTDTAWEDMLAEFRGLGGTADNIRAGSAGRGPGLYPIDPTRPVVLRIPHALIFPVEDVAFKDGRIGIKDSASAGRAERTFFGNYANTFSWGGGGRHEAREFIAALDSLSTDIREHLSAGFGMGEFLDADAEERVRRWYLRSRMKAWNTRNVLIPIVEMANRDPAGLQFRRDGQNNLHIEGRAQDEILIHQNALDAFGLFRSTGNALHQPLAYSLPHQLNVDGRSLRIERNIGARVMRGNFQVPVARAGKDEIVFSHLMTGNSNFPRLSRGIFVTLMREMGTADANETFDNILYFNRRSFLNLLGALEPHEGPMITSLRRTARFQLDALSQCVGSREI